VKMIAIADECRAEPETQLQTFNGRAFIGVMVHLRR
jgi:hypothetical protein